MSDVELESYKKRVQQYESQEEDLKQKADKDTETRTQNWLDLSDHFQIKVQKRTSEVAFLQTKAGFLIAAAVIVIQLATSQGVFKNDVMAVLLGLAVIVAFISLIVALISMHMTATSALKPDRMITDLNSAEHYNMTREHFARWLAESYAATNTKFNKEYTSKYRQQKWAAILLVVALGVIIVLKGLNTYVGFR
jgi:hypothetical protein